MQGIGNPSGSSPFPVEQNKKATEEGTSSGNRVTALSTTQRQLVVDESLLPGTSSELPPVAVVTLTTEQRTRWQLLDEQHQPMNPGTDLLMPLPISEKPPENLFMSSDDEQTTDDENLAFLQPEAPGATQPAPVQAREHEATSETVPWDDGVNFAPPLFEDREHFNAYCLDQLCEQTDERKSCLVMLGKGLPGYELTQEEIKDQKKAICDRVRAGEDSAKKVYAVYLMHENPGFNFAKLASRISILLKKGGKSPIGAAVVKSWFFQDTVPELYALGTIFRHYLARLIDLADPKSKEGRNATYWLVRLLRLKNSKMGNITGALNRESNSVANPFGGRWTPLHVEAMLGTSVTDLVKQMSEADAHNTRPRQMLLTLADNGNLEALTALIEFYRNQKHQLNGDIAYKLQGRVTVPGLIPVTRDWHSHMIEQYLMKQDITPEVPDWYANYVESSKRLPEKTETQIERLLRLPSMQSDEAKAKLRGYTDSDSDDAETHVVQKQKRVRGARKGKGSPPKRLKLSIH